MDFPKCAGTLNIQGMGSVIPAVTQVNTPGRESAEVEVIGGATVVPRLGGRAYFSDTCNENAYTNTQYTGLALLGKTLRYTADLSGTGCGCNAAFYLVSMRQNTQPGSCNDDYYCDANSVCGVRCAELDLQEANMYAWHTTLHTADDSSGKGGGYGGGGGWEGPRDFTSGQYSPGGLCIDTTMPFQVAASFPVDAAGVLTAVEVTLSQAGKSCPLTISISDYSMAEIGDALAQGMTPVVSYWAADDMLWLDGQGADRQGGCASDHKDACPDTVRFHDFSVFDIGGDYWSSPTPAAPAPLVYTDPAQLGPNRGQPDFYAEGPNREEPGSVYAEPAPAPAEDALYVQAGCHTVPMDQCCSHLDGRPELYGTRCVMVADVVAPSRDVGVPCQPQSWVDGSIPNSEWVGFVVGCSGDAQAAIQAQPTATPSTFSPKVFSWLPNPFKMLLMKYSSAAPAEGVEPNVTHLTDAGTAATLAFAAAAIVLLVVRAARQSRSPAGPSSTLYEELQQTGLRRDAEPDAAPEPEVV